jgi:hypothetical protein
MDDEPTLAPACAAKPWALPPASVRDRKSAISAPGVAARMKQART